MKLVQDRHFEEYGVRPLYTARVPGITRFLGPFADYSGGCCLCAADSRVLIMCVSVRGDSLVRVFNSLANDRKRFSLSSLRFRREDRWANYIKGAIAGLVAGNDRIPGLDITLGGNLLPGDNAIVCSSVIVAMGMVLHDMLGTSLDDSVLGSMASSVCMSFCGQSCLNSVVRCMLNARKGSFVFFDNRRNIHTMVDDPFPDSRYALLLVDSGLPVGVMNDELERRHEEMRLLMHDNASGIAVSSLLALNEQDMRVRLAGVTEDSRRIYMYLFEEFRAAQITSFSELAVARALGRTGKALRNILDLSFPELDWIMKRSLEMSDCIGASVAVTGGTGKVAVAINRNALDYYRSKLEDYEHIFGFKVGISEFEPNSGAEVFKGY